MNFRSSPAALAVCFGFLMISVAYGQTPTASDAHSSSETGASASASAGIPAADRSFAIEAAQAGTAEIADAKLALQNSDRQDVKDFAQRMVTDHTKAADQLKSIAGGEGITLPSSESKADQSDTDALQKLSGGQFDRRYIEIQRKAHKQAVALFAKESKNGKDNRLKTFAGQTLPTLQDHLKMATAMPVSQTASAPPNSGRSP